MLSLLFAVSLSASDAHAQDALIDFGTSGSVDTGESDRYVIQPGDTLWDISTAFMGDAYYWPQLWSFNDYITNPHWIYPGQYVVFRPGTLLDPPEMDVPDVRDEGYTAQTAVLVDAELECGPDARFVGQMESSRYSAPHFLADPDDVEVWGSVMASKSGHHQVAEGELIYLDLDDVDAVGCGDVVTIMRETDEVRHPESRGTSYGSLWDVVGHARILHIDEEERVTAVVRIMYRPVHRGDLVGPVITTDAEVAGVPPRGNLDGQVLALGEQDLRMLSGAGDTVFVDRGRADGLRVGNSLYVIHNRDYFESPFEDDLSLPEHVAGRIIITDVSENHAKGVIVRASMDMNVGDKVSQTVQ
ncbi:MAG: LysM peptidoglycan-binding domain-containing protein [Proteobacteria bacterium]|nr:LysM peptidoglycan-binding domain-containing protein [Pseudomonadota bacterium]